jgi:MFS family permease
LRAGSSIFYHLRREHGGGGGGDDAGGQPSGDHGAVAANALFWGAVGALGLLTFAVLFAASRRGAGDRELLALGAVLCTLGSLLCTDVPVLPPLRLWRFCAGMALAWGVGYPLAQATAVSALTKVLRADKLGAFLAYQTMAGSAGRVAGPLLAGALYDGSTGHACVALAAASCAACCLLVAAMWSHMH